MTHKTDKEETVHMHTLSQFVHFSISHKILPAVILAHGSTPLSYSYITALGWRLFCFLGWSMKSNNLRKLPESGTARFGVTHLNLQVVAQFG